jgi:signal peptidase II
VANFGKMLFYDWAGGNEALFTSINGAYSGEVYDSIALLVSRVADYKNFPYYLVLMVFCALLDYSIRKLRGRGGASHSLVAWFGVICVVVAAFEIDGEAVKWLKHFIEFPRPYVALAPEDVRLLEYQTDRSDDYHSFPSGHVSFVTTLVASVWPVISSGTRKIGMCCVLLVCWSRIAVGMHFPADVFYAVDISVLITFFVRWFIYKQLLRFGLKC